MTFNTAHVAPNVLNVTRIPGSLCSRCVGQYTALIAVWHARRCVKCCSAAKQRTFNALPHSTALTDFCNMTSDGTDEWPILYMWREGVFSRMETLFCGRGIVVALCHCVCVCVCTNVVRLIANAACIVAV